ncbi:hypothetical protein HJC23_011027 [Cyclotella cryptica]|uniref:Uncharacterized protein n=1 Tax=Cyclotella cryptica TaxID=29204 RepID=A0ABD3PFB8_9STRA|eukprot:CCRYP_015209-RA/>CCRYP_015209-RA protein AED:0.17 eAED:0.17 QI:0/-1/0/1/-1/1/1/0/383
MREAPPIRRTMSESSFLQSLASIHLEPRLRRSSMSHHTVGDKGSAQSNTNQKGAARPGQIPVMGANLSNVAPAVLENTAKDPKLQDEKERIAIQGILRSQDLGKDKDVALPSQRRVSFSHQIESKLDHRMSNFDFTLNSPPDNALDACSEDAQGVINPSIPPDSKGLTTSSVKSSFHCVPPQPPRASSCNDKTRDISSMFQTSQRISLPFQTTPATRPSRPMRRYSMLEMDQIHRQQNGCKASSPTGVSHSSLSLQRRRSDGVILEKIDRNTSKENCYIRKDYTLGNKARSASHMIIESCPQKALERASQLKNYDFAFVKRMDGSWTYAILAYRSYDKDESDSSEEECMLFVMNEEGSTKMIKKRHWAEFVRCVVNEEGIGSV